jgi:hypothetical protein
VFQAVHLNNADPQVLAYQYLQMLPQLAQAQGSTFWVIPSEVTTALKTLSSAFSGETATPPAPALSPGTVTGAAAALPADGPQPGPGANGEPASAGQVYAAEAAQAREELAEVEREVAAVEREVAEAENAAPR